MIEIKAEEKNTLKINQKAFVTTREHGSVGIKSKIESSDQSIVAIIKSSFKYSNQTTPIQPGGDGGSKTTILKALKEGETTISVKSIFRGRLDDETRIKIKVVSA